MRKLLVVVLTVVLVLLPGSVLAETYTHDAVAYSFEVPEGWMVLSSSTAQALMEIGFELVDEDSLTQMLETIQQMDIVYLLASDYNANINILLQESANVTADQYLALEEILLASVLEQIPGAEQLNACEIIELESGDFFAMSYAANFIGLDQYFYQYIINSDSYMYNITLTLTGADMDEAQDQIMKDFLSSLQLV